jgi:hypothetical protein
MLIPFDTCTAIHVRFTGLQPGVQNAELLAVYCGAYVRQLCKCSLVIS